MDLDKAIKSRKSVRHFAKKKPNWKTIIECIDSVRYTPMAGNIFPLKFIIVDDEKKIKKLSEAAQQPFIAEAQYVVVVCSDNKLVLNSYQERAEKFLKQETGAAIQNLLLKIEEAGLKTCWIGWFVEYLAREALGIPKNISVEAFFPIGYESKVPGSTRSLKKKMDLSNILYFNKWKNKRMKKEKKLEV